MSNLPPGVTQKDLDGPPMLLCKRCGLEYSGYPDDPCKLCPDCYQALEDDSTFAKQLERKVNQLLEERTKLLYYVRHDHSCQMPLFMCTCGLNNLLNSLQKPSH